MEDLDESGFEGSETGSEYRCGSGVSFPLGRLVYWLVEVELYCEGGMGGGCGCYCLFFEDIFDGDV